jgi:hypothetical protein
MTAEERAFLVAEKAHRNQTYDIYPYLYHIKQVHAIAKQLGYDETIRVACILHDALEDTELSYNDLKKAFGEEVAEIVYCVTDELGRNRTERKEKTFPKILSNWKATVVKLCDRIANIKQSKLYNIEKYKMYRKESAVFVNELKCESHPHETERAWDMFSEISGASVLFSAVQNKKTGALSDVQNKKFKKGDWIIAKWRDSDGGETDFCKFIRDAGNNLEFYCSNFYRIKGKEISRLTERQQTADYLDGRFEFGFRLATKSEIKKYTGRIEKNAKKTIVI